MQKKKSFIKRIIFAGALCMCVIAAFYAVLSISPSMLMAAQSLDIKKVLEQGIAEKDAQEDSVTRANKYVLKDIDIISSAFPNNKRGCMTKASMFLAASKSYKDGKAIEEIVPMKAFQPIFEQYYSNLQKNGVGKAAQENFDEFIKCARTAKPYEDSEKEKEFNAKYSKCQNFSDMIFDVVGMIENRKSAQTIMAKYKGQKLDLSGTAYQDMPEPAVFFSGQLYSRSKKGTIEDVQEMGATLALSCYM